MARVLKMPEISKPRYCPICGGTNLEFHSTGQVSKGTTYRYKCDNGHISIIVIDRPAAAASGE